MTRAQAVAAQWGDLLYHATEKGRDGKPAKCRVSGRCTTWKTMPDDFKLPVRYGLYRHFYITEDNADEWSVT